MKLSFIIPAFNEEEHISAVIDAIIRYCPADIEREIVVVDNGSTDSTRRLVASKKVKLIQKPGISIAALRNAGAKEANGDIFVFLDADVYLTDLWLNEIPNTIDQIVANPILLTGSTCSVDDKGSWIERCWFMAVQARTRVNYINSGHLIISRGLFESISGFNERLETGEDVDIAQRALKYGAYIINNPKLKAIHAGFPKTVFHFFKRERWHGRGDYSTIRLFLRSKPAIFSVVQSLIFILSLILAFILKSWLPIFGFLVFLFVLSLGASLYRSARIDWCLTGSLILYPIYFFARSLALVDVVLETLFQQNHNHPESGK